MSLSFPEAFEELFLINFFFETDDLFEDCDFNLFLDAVVFYALPPKPDFLNPFPDKVPILCLLLELLLALAFTLFLKLTRLF